MKATNPSQRTIPSASARASPCARTAAGVAATSSGRSAKFCQAKKRSTLRTINPTVPGVRLKSTGRTRSAMKDELGQADRQKGGADCDGMPPLSAPQECREPDQVQRQMRGDRKRRHRVDQHLRRKDVDEQHGPTGATVLVEASARDVEQSYT